MKMKNGSNVTVDYLQKNAQYLDIVIPYYGDDDGHLITFNVQRGVCESDARCRKQAIETAD